MCRNGDLCSANCPLKKLRRMRSVMSLLMGGNDNAQPLPRLENRCRCYWNFHTPTTIEMLLSVGHCQAKIFRSNHNGKTSSWNAMGESSTPPFPQPSALRQAPAQHFFRNRAFGSTSSPTSFVFWFRDVPLFSLIAANRVYASQDVRDVVSKTMNRDRPDFPAGGSVM